MSTAAGRAARRERIARDEMRMQAAKGVAARVAGMARVQQMAAMVAMFGMVGATGAIETL